MWRPINELCLAVAGADQSHSFLSDGFYRCAPLGSKSETKVATFRPKQSQRFCNCAIRSVEPCQRNGKSRRSRNSRGIRLSALLVCRPWWEGPHLLRENRVHETNEEILVLFEGAEREDRPERRPRSKTSPNSRLNVWTHVSLTSLSLHH